MVDTEFAELLRHALLAAMHVGAPVLVVAWARASSKRRPGSTRRPSASCRDSSSSG